MKLSFRSFGVHKRVPLSISRGTQTSSHGWEVRVLHDGIESMGEAAEFSIPSQAQPHDFLGKELERAIPILRPFSPWQRFEVECSLKSHGIASSAIAGIDMALYDWLGKATQQPVWRLLGLPMQARVPTSVTIGISSPEAGQQRLVQWMELGVVRAVKIKMGSPDGIPADQALFEAVAKLLPSPVQISVDANGGWSTQDAVSMCRWLAERGVDHVEQPTEPGQLSALRTVHRESPIPIVADESCCTSRDIPHVSDACGGINIKLPKCGGLSEALRLIACARAHDLKIMLGCYSQTTLGNSAANQLASLVDYVDLDSHLNLQDDPFLGCRFEDGYLHNRELPGFGVAHA